MFCGTDAVLCCAVCALQYIEEARRAKEKDGGPEATVQGEGRVRKVGGGGRQRPFRGAARVLPQGLDASDRARHPRGPSRCASYVSVYLYTVRVIPL